MLGLRVCQVVLLLYRSSISHTSFTLYFTPFFYTSSTHTHTHTHTHIYIYIYTVATNLNVSVEPRIRENVARYYLKSFESGERVAVLGVVPDNFETNVKPQFVENLRFELQIGAVRAAVAELEHQGVNKILLLGDTFLSEDLIGEVNGIDACVIPFLLYANRETTSKHSDGNHASSGGHREHDHLQNHSDAPRRGDVIYRDGGEESSSDDHDHDSSTTDVQAALGSSPHMVSTPWAGLQVPIGGPGTNGMFVGYLDLQFDQYGVVRSSSGDSLLLDRSIAPDPEVAAMVAEFYARVQEFEQETLGRARCCAVVCVCVYCVCVCVCVCTLVSVFACV
jgi:hypothetical protein